MSLVLFFFFLKPQQPCSRTDKTDRRHTRLPSGWVQTRPPEQCRNSGTGVSRDPGPFRDQGHGNLWGSLDLEGGTGCWSDKHGLCPTQVTVTFSLGTSVHDRQVHLS